MASIADWSSRDVLDLGCGSGFHLPRFATTARHVLGVEPHPPCCAWPPGAPGR
jgi:predicted RNA methylase